MITSFILVGLIFSNMSALAQEEDKNADEILARMKTQLNLTNAQVMVVKPIIREYVYRCQNLMQGPETVLAHSEIRNQRKRLKKKKIKNSVGSLRLIK